MVYHPYCCFDFLNAKTAVWFSQKEQNQIAFFVWCKEAKAKHVDILLSNTPLILHIIVKINALGSFCMLKMTDSQCFFVLLQLTFVSLSRHIRKRRALLILAIYSQILAKFEYTKGSGCNNAHATDIYYPERGNYILALRERLLLIHLCRQCEKPDGRISKIQSSRFLHL